MRNDVSVLTATFNRHDFTVNMLKSLARNVDSLPQIMILDNSDKIYFSKIPNDFITVLDNTNFKYTKDYKQPSMNHCSSLDWALEKITTRYVMICDNDILFKPSIMNLFNDLDKYDVIGEIGFDKVPPNRIFPYLCFIDLAFYRNNKIRYFDASRCMTHNANRMDTGCSFYEDVKHKNGRIKHIKLTDYIVHLKNGTLKNKALSELSY